MTGFRISGGQKLTAAVVLGLGLAGLVGCSSSGSDGPNSTTRTSEQTAPTDLQLLCASRAAEQLGITSGKVLPTASAPSGDDGYQVSLTYDGGNASCTIDADGNVLAVQKI